MTFTDSKERAKAFGVFGAVASSGAAVGLLLGGMLTEYADWRWCLFVNVGIAFGVFVASRGALPNPPRFEAARVEVVSAVLATAGLAAFVFGCSQAAPHGWSSAVVIGSLGGGAVAIGAFVARQRMIAAPLLPLRILADRNRAGAYLAAATAVIGVFGMFLMLTNYLQAVRHYSPVHAGVAVLPLTLANSLSGYQLGSRLLPRVAPRMLIAGGLFIAAAGLALLAQLDVHSSYATSVLPAEVLIGTGMGALFPPAFSLAIHGVTQRDAGVASAVINAATQVGSSIGTALLNTLAVSATAGYFASHAPSPTLRVAALVHGYASATAWSAGLLAAVGVVAYVLINAPRPPVEH
jgi:MFS family permease